MHRERDAPTKASNTPSHRRPRVSAQASHGGWGTAEARVDALFERVESALLAKLSKLERERVESALLAPRSGSSRSSRRTRTARRQRAELAVLAGWAGAATEPRRPSLTGGGGKAPRTPFGRLCRELELAWQIRWTVEVFLYHWWTGSAWQTLDHAGDSDEALRDLDN